jgi:hypothetical protein
VRDLSRQKKYGRQELAHEQEELGADLLAEDKKKASDRKNHRRETATNKVYTHLSPSFDYWIRNLIHGTLLI